MRHTIYLTESQVCKLALMQEDLKQHSVVYDKFEGPVLDFIRSLLKDPNPARAEFGEVFTKNGISKDDLERSLRKHSVLSSKQRISDDQGDKSAHYIRRYIRNSENIDAKLHEVYDELFAKKEVNECTSCGATSCGGVGAGNGLDFPAFSTVRRTFATHKRKKKKRRKDE